MQYIAHHIILCLSIINSTFANNHVMQVLLFVHSQEFEALAAMKKR